MLQMSENGKTALTPLQDTEARKLMQARLQETRTRLRSLSYTVSRISPSAAVTDKHDYSSSTVSISSSAQRPHKANSMFGVDDSLAETDVGSPAVVVHHSDNASRQKPKSPHLAQCLSSTPGTKLSAQTKVMHEQHGIVKSGADDSPMPSPIADESDPLHSSWTELRKQESDLKLQQQALAAERHDIEALLAAALEVEQRTRQAQTQIEEDRRYLLHFRESVAVNLRTQVTNHLSRVQLVATE